MPVRFTLPDLGEGLVDAEIVAWRVGVGDRVRRDQPLVEVETAKASVEIPSPAAGTVLRLGGEAGDVLPVGALLVELADEAGPAPGPAAPQDRPVPAAPQAGLAAGGAPPLAVGSAGPSGRRRVLASPSTRARATALGLDLAAIVGSGDGGRVTRDDVERAARAARPDLPAVAPPDSAAAQAGGSASPLPSASPSLLPSPPAGTGDHDVPLRGIRREIARTMTRSWQQIPHITEFREVDATALVGAHRALRERRPPDRRRLTLLPILALATVAALRHHPLLNASLDMDSETVHHHGGVHLGIATATPEGLVVPVVRGADRMGLAALTDAIGDVVDAARARRAGVGQTTGGTFTVSNFGSYGTWLGTPVINPPQAGIAGFGRIRDAVVAVDGQPVVRPTLPVAVSADHRLIDGDVLGAFVSELASLLSDPVLLLGES